jgi:RND family efflux transporter MFP subunit
MPETDQATLPPAPEHPLLDRPGEERLQAEIESLRKQLDEARNGSSGKPKKKTLIWIGVILLAILLIAFFAGFLPHYRHERQLKSDAEKEARALPSVSFVAVAPSGPTSQLLLPGNIEAMTESPVLARASGYLRKRSVDIGDRVRAGQLMGEIDAPDLDQQVEQAKSQLLQARAAVIQAIANLDQGKANQDLSHITAIRWAALLKRGAVSRQENDQYQDQDLAQIANVHSLDDAVSVSQQAADAAQANLDRLLNLQAYEQVRAPFAGVVTLRNVDVGALITTGTTLLFRVAQTDRLRIYVFTPQASAPMIRTGQQAVLRLAEYPGRTFPGLITRTSNSLDPSSRTLLTEVQVPNPSGTLLPGMFADVQLQASRTARPILIPGDSLLVRSNGTQVAVLTDTGSEAKGFVSEEEQKKAEKDKKKSKQAPGGKGGESVQSTKTGDKSDKGGSEVERASQEAPVFVVHLVQVTVGRDYGNEIEILTGLNQGDRVVVNPNDDVVENARVRGFVQKSDSAAQSGGQSNSNLEKMAPQPGGDIIPKDPSKEQKNRGPGQ